MDKAEHGKRLTRAMAGRSRQVIADWADVKPRTVTNWTSGKTMPSEGERAALRKLLGPYDAEGDPVEIAVRSSELTEDRQDTVLGFYKRHLREQREARSA